MNTPLPIDGPHVLVVDDDERLRRLLARYLGENGFRVTAAENAAEARARLEFLEPDVMVVDVSMPGESGLQLTESLRHQRDIPVMLLTARGAPEDRIAGFEAGADDYLPKPFDPRELVLRIRALLRRASTPPPVITTTASNGPLKLGIAEFDPARNELTGPHGAIRLTAGEIALLSALARRPNEIMSREEISEFLGMDEQGERAIDVQVTRLRRKIEADPREPRFLLTLRGKGYMLRPDR